MTKNLKPEMLGIDRFNNLNGSLASAQLPNPATFSGSVTIQGSVWIMGSPTAVNEVANKGYVDGKNTKLSSFTGSLASIQFPQFPAAFSGSVTIAGSLVMSGSLILMGSPTVADEAANKGYVDARPAGTGGWISVGSLVFDGSVSVSGTYQDLDLSSLMTATGSVVVLLKYKNNHWATANILAARPNGDTTSQDGSDASGTHCSYCIAGKSGYVLINTDSAKVIEIRATALYIQIWLEGYLRA